MDHFDAEPLIKVLNVLHETLFQSDSLVMQKFLSGLRAPIIMHAELINGSFKIVDLIEY